MLLNGALDTSNSGVLAASNALDVTGNNIANSTTTGFKAQQVSFQDLLYSGLQAAASSSGQPAPGPIQYGSGTTVAATTGLFTQGGLTPTGQQFDLAINGQGFFAVTLPNGTTAYTRAGNLTQNANGRLVTSDGFFLATNITIPTNASSVSVGPDGTVTAVTPTGTQTLGQIQLTQFQNPGGLSRIGDTTFVATSASGTAVAGVPGTNGLGTLTQGSLEQSNVNLSTELVNLIIAQQTFTYNAQAIQVEDQMLQSATSLIQ